VLLKNGRKKEDTYNLAHFYTELLHRTRNSLDVAFPLLSVNSLLHVIALLFTSQF